MGGQIRVDLIRCAPISRDGIWGTVLFDCLAYSDILNIALLNIVGLNQSSDNTRSKVPKMIHAKSLRSARTIKYHFWVNEEQAGRAQVYPVI